MSPTLYRLAADIVVVVHFAFVAFVLFGQLAIVLGVMLRWGWVRNMTFRIVHLLSILVVVAEAVAGMTCPLTTWEHDLRALAGQATYAGDFIPNLVHDMLFYDAEGWIFTASYIAFGLLVVGTFIVAPPRRARRKSDISANVARSDEEPLQNEN